MSSAEPKSTHASQPTTSSLMASKPLTLILAATPSLGIGRAGGLPWPQLKKEMGYFARVTKRTSPTQVTEGDAAGQLVEKRRRINAVVMGRKTWDSIPPRFRPLAGRVNVVVTRDVGGFVARVRDGKDEDKKDGVEGPLVAGSVQDALAQLQSDAVAAEVDKVMVIGGASIYEQALKLDEARFVLLTKIQKDFECDTFFKEDLEGGRWRKAGVEEIKAFTGEEFEGGTTVVEKGVEFEFCLYSRVD